MTMQDIIYVTTIAKEKSFSKAAARLYVTQSAISQSIAKLERELEVTLFSRSNKQVLPTQACLHFIEKAQPLLHMYDQFQSDMKLLKQEGMQRIRVGVSSFFSRFLPFQKEIMASPDKSYEVEIEENVSAIIEQMAIDGKVDFCFTRAPLLHSELQQEPLFTEELFLAVPASHPVCSSFPASKRNPYPTVDLATFRDSSFVMINNSFITPQCIRMCHDAGFTPHILATTTVWERIYPNVTDLGLVGFISCVHAKPYSAKSPVRYFRINSPDAFLENVVAYLSRDNLSANSRQYIDAFREYLLPQLPT